MAFEAAFAYLPAVISFSAFVVACRHVWRGSFQPEPVSRGIWMVVSAIALVLLLEASDSLAAVPLGIGLFGGSVLLFALSLRASVFHWHKDDFLAISGAVVCLLVWLITGNPFIALIAILATDLVAFVPTYAKVWHTPITEDPVFWALLALASSLSMFDLLLFTQFEASNLLYNSYILAGQFAMFTFVILRRRKLGVVKATNLNK